VEPSWLRTSSALHYQREAVTVFHLRGRCAADASHPTLVRRDTVTASLQVGPSFTVSGFGSLPLPASFVACYFFLRS